MTTVCQKEQELDHLIKALDLAGVRDYSLIDKDGESPDFLIDIAGKITGVEVTSIYRDLGTGNLAKAESDIPVIIKAVVDVYNREGGSPVVFAFALDGNVVVRSRNKTAKKIGLFLCEYMKKNFPLGITRIEEIDFNQLDDESLSVVSSVIAQPTDSTTAVGVATSGFDSVPAAEQEIEKAVRKKEKLLSQYLSRCDKIWLIVVLPSMNMAGDFELQENKSICFNSSFDMVYILDDYRDRLATINKA